MDSFIYVLIENTRLVSFDIKFTRQGFEIAFEKQDSVLVSYIIEFYIREPVNRMDRVHLLQ